MVYQKQLYTFYQPHLKQSWQTIIDGQAIFFVGINTIGKTLLVEQLLSSQFRKDFVGSKSVYLVPIILKDRESLTTSQLFSYWLSQTAKSLGREVTTDKINQFSFYSKMAELIQNMGKDEKIAFIVLDAQLTFSCDEAFFQSLIYLQIYSYGKVSYIFLSEPQILNHKNPGLLRLIQRYENRSNFVFLKTHDKKTVIADIHRQEKLMNLSFMRYIPMITRYGRGLHGVTRTFCYLLKDNSQVKNIRSLMNLAYRNKQCEYWVHEVLASLPDESLKILREVVGDKKRFLKYHRSVYGKWLIKLTFLKSNGTLRYPLIIPLLASYQMKKDQNKPKFKRSGNKFFINGEIADLTKKEFGILNALYQKRGRVVDSDTLGNFLWKDSSENFSLWAIAQIVSRLRKKLSIYAVHPNTIQSVRGKGYLLEKI